MDEIEQMRQTDPDDFFNIIPKRKRDIEYYKLAIKLLEDAMEKAELISFDTTKEEEDLIVQIIKRIDSYVRVDSVPNRFMDIAACHCNGCRLDLKKFLNFDRLSFLHDVVGITACLDRETGKLTNGFRPRCAA